MRVLAAALAATALLASAAAAQMEVVRRGPETVESGSGTLTVAFALRNHGSAATESSVRVHPPAGVRAILPQGHRRVEGGAEALVLVPLRVSEATPAGRHLVRVEVEGGGADSVWIEVAPRRAVSAEPLDAGRMVVAGEGYTTRFRLRNTGNTAERVSLAASDDGGTRAAGPREAVLAPGEEVTVAYEVRTAALGHRNLRHQVTLRLAGADSLTAVARSLVEVVPRGAGGRQSAAGVPVEARLRSDASGRAGYELRGASRGLSFALRSADPVGTLFARPDEYVLALRSRRLDLLAGDGAFGLSALGGGSRRLAGAQAAVRAGPLAAGGYAAGDRRSEEGWAVERVGGFLRIGTERGGVGAVHDGGASLEAWLRPGPLLGARAEVALPDGVGPLARDLRLAGTSRALAYDLRHLRVRSSADSRLHHDAASVSLRPWSWLYATGAYRRGWAGAPDTTLVRALPARESSRLAVELFRAARFELRQWQDGDAAASFRAVRAGVSLRAGRLTLTPAAEQGERRPLGGAAAVPFRAGELRGGWSRRAATLSATVRVEAAEELSWTGAVHGTLPLAPGLMLRGSASGARSDLEVPFTGYAHAELERALGRGHALLLRGSRRWGVGAERRPFLRVEYRLPLSLPVGRGAAGLAVRVVDASTGRPVSGAAVRVAGRTALTGGGGAARVDGLPPGTHLLRVARTDVGAPWITRGGGGVEVAVGAHGEGRAEVEVAAAGTVSGRVLRIPAGGGPPEPMAGVQVVLRASGGELRVRTGADGGFRFEGLWPGWWRAAISARSLPPHHEAREAGEPVLVRAGAEAEVELRATERERRMRIIGGGEIASP